MKTTKNNVGDMVIENVFRIYDVYEELTEEEKERAEIEEVKSISKEKCDSKDIDVSLIALDELEKIGFKKDIKSVVLSKLIEDVFHERDAFSTSEYFNLSCSENDHYTRLANYFKAGNEQLYISIIAKAIIDSDAESKNINDIVYGTVKKISIKMDKSLKLKAEA